MSNEFDYFRLMRETTMGKFIEREDYEEYCRSVTPTKAKLEVVPVAMAPSLMFDVFVDSWFTQLDRVFRGANYASRPILTDDEDKDKDLFLRYMETLFWRKMVSIHPEYCRTDEQKALKNEIRKRVVTPGLFANAVAALGVVTVYSMAIRLEPEYIQDYDYANRLLTLDDFRDVTSWLEELQEWGFVGFNGFNPDPEGNLDFMLMTAAEDMIEQQNQAAVEGEGSETEAEWKPKCNFVVTSQKASSNIIALYRYFFYNEKVKYLSDYRNIYSYSTFDDDAEVLRYIVKKMIYEDNTPSFLERDKVKSDSGSQSGDA